MCEFHVSHHHKKPLDVNSLLPLCNDDNKYEEFRNIKTFFSVYPKKRCNLICIFRNPKENKNRIIYILDIILKYCSIWTRKNCSVPQIVLFCFVENTILCRILMNVCRWGGRKTHNFSGVLLILFFHSFLKKIRYLFCKKIELESLGKTPLLLWPIFSSCRFFPLIIFSLFVLKIVFSTALNITQTYYFSKCEKLLTGLPDFFLKKMWQNKICLLVFLTKLCRVSLAKLYDCMNHFGFELVFLFESKVLFSFFLLENYSFFK